MNWVMRVMPEDEIEARVEAILAGRRLPFRVRVETVVDEVESYVRVVVWGELPHPDYVNGRPLGLDSQLAVALGACHVFVGTPHDGRTVIEVGWTIPPPVWRANLGRWGRLNDQDMLNLLGGGE